MQTQQLLLCFKHIKKFRNVRLACALTVLYFSDRIPAECNLGFTPPDLWVIGRCAQITMNCIDPTLGSNDRLSYTPSGNYTQGFILTSNVNGLIDICYNRTISDYYEVSWL